MNPLLFHAIVLQVLGFARCVGIIEPDYTGCGGIALLRSGVRPVNLTCSRRYFYMRLERFVP
jgi:hypothetical protein